MANTGIPTLIAHERRFVAYSIASLLEGTEFDVVANVSGVEDIETIDVSAGPKVCVVGAYGTDLSDVCETLRARFPGSRLALLDAGETRDLTRVALAQKLEGCLSFDLTPDLILSGLKLVAAGTRCFPEIPPDAMPNGSHLDADHTIHLTPRESAVLTLIGQGMANKVIARELDITESTVKAHLNSVLRKTGTSNRTQAARWAFQHGKVA